jgi:hypothetical protein
MNDFIKSDLKKLAYLKLTRLLIISYFTQAYGIASIVTYVQVIETRNILKRREHSFPIALQISFDSLLL